MKKLISTSYAPDAKKMNLLAEPSLFEMDAPQFDPTKAQTKGKIFILDKDLTGDGNILKEMGISAVKRLQNFAMKQT